MDISGGDYDMVWASDSSGMTMWDIETQTSTSVTLLSQDAQEDDMGAVTVEGMIMDPIDPAIMFPFYVGIANVLWPCADCGMDEFGMPLCALPNNEMGMCDTSQEGEVSVYVPGDAAVTVGIHHTGPGTLTILGGTSDLEVLNPDETPFTSAYVTSESSLPIIIRAGETFSGEVTLVARFIQDNAQLDTQDSIKVKKNDCCDKTLEIVYKDHWSGPAPKIDWGEGTLKVDMPDCNSQAPQKAKITLDFKKAAAANAMEFDFCQLFKFTLATKDGAANWTNTELDKAGTWNAQSHQKTVIFEINLPASQNERTMLFDIYAEQPEGTMLWVPPPAKNHGTLWKLSGRLKWKTDANDKYVKSCADNLAAEQAMNNDLPTNSIPTRNVDHP